MRLRPSWLLLAVTISLSCEHAGPLEPETSEPTFSDIQTNIFSRSCALSGCHAGPGAQRGLDLSEGAAYGNLVNVRSREVPDLFRVNPGDPDASYLMMKIRGAPGIVGARMPAGRDPLSGDEIETIGEWIRRGAPENE